MKLTPWSYRWLTRLALPLAKLYLLKRARKQPAYKEHWDERFGRCAYPRSDRPTLWLHAVSLGETNAARSLVESCLRDFPECRVLLTCMTPTGREAGARLVKAYPGRVDQCYLPYDTPELMGKFLDDVRPCLGILMETEVWPNLLDQAKRRDIPMILANARESEKSRAKAERADAVMRPAFESFAAVLAQSPADAERLASLGAHNVHVCGSVKFDIHPDAAQVATAKDVKERIARPVLLLASTRQDEEKLFVPHLARLPAEVLVLLVPRHPERFDEVAELLERNNVPFVRKSRMPKLDAVSAQTRVILGDTMGEMSFNTAMADVCIMGGSFGPFGCQNLIEPAASGAPVIVGRSTFNFAQVVDDALKMQAAVSVETALEAIETATCWFYDGRLSQRAECARRFANSYTGATEKMMKWVRALWNKQNASRMS